VIQHPLFSIGQILTIIGNITLMTGTVDYLSDGERVIAIENGHELLGQVTGVRPSPSPLLANH